MASRLDLATAIAADQDGLITVAQCVSLGFSAGELDSMVKSRRWRGAFRGVYFTRPEIMSDRQRIRAALLSLGPMAVAVLTSAGIIHRWPVVPKEATVQVSLPAAGRRLDQPGLTARQLVVTADDGPWWHQRSSSSRCTTTAASSSPSPTWHGPAVACSSRRTARRCTAGPRRSCAIDAGRIS